MCCNAVERKRGGDCGIGTMRFCLSGPDSRTGTDECASKGAWGHDADLTCCEGRQGTCWVVERWQHGIGGAPVFSSYSLSFGGIVCGRLLVSEGGGWREE